MCFTWKQMERPPPHTNTAPTTTLRLPLPSSAPSQPSFSHLLCIGGQAENKTSSLVVKMVPYMRHSEVLFVRRKVQYSEREETQGPRWQQNPGLPW